MAITQEEFDALVARLEYEAARRPRLYDLRLGAFALLGYVYVLVILAVLVLIGGILFLSIKGGFALLLLAKKLIIPIVILVGVVLRAMWIKLEAPEGQELQRKQYPVLFRTIDEIRRGVGAPRAHTVLLTDDLNAAITQVPRLGMLGWQKNYLILGLPLMQLLSADEFKAVLAHEFGHLSRSHGRFGAWIYRVRAAWSRLNDELQTQQHWGSFMFVPFFGWFAPRFAAYSFVKARHQEYEADRLAANAIGAPSLAHALVRLRLKAEELGTQFWPSILAAADVEPTPQQQPYRELMDAGRRGFTASAPEQLRVALTRETSTADTHPSLKDRLDALSEHAACPPAVSTSAATALLGAELNSLVEHFDTQWRSAVSDWWSQRHAYVVERKAKLADYQARDASALTNKELYDRAFLTEEFGERDDAMGLYAAVLEREAEHVGALYSHGRLLLKREDERGLALLEKAMELDAFVTMPACDTIVGYLRASGRDAESQPYIDRYHAREVQEERIRIERNTFMPGDSLQPHEMPVETLAQLQAQLKRNGDLKRALLARKTLEHSKEPVYVLGVEARVDWWRMNGDERAVELADALAQSLDLNVDMHIVPLTVDNAFAKKMLARVAGARL